MYWDINILYRWEMSQKSPVGGLERTEDSLMKTF